MTIILGGDSSNKTFPLKEQDARNLFFFHNQENYFVSHHDVGCDRQNESNPVCIYWQKPTIAGHELFHVLHVNERGKRRKSSPGTGVIIVVTSLVEDGGSVGGSR